MKYFAWLTLAILVALPFSITAQRSFDVDILADTFGFDSTTKKTVELDQLQQGCGERDCIPSIDAPKYVSAANATHIAHDAIVITLAYKGEYRAYPARILDQHEIVNDIIAGNPIAITWCPLCGSAVGIHRDIAGKVTEFGVSGVLYNSDLVLYDRATETLWDQIEAKGIVGPMTGEKLRLFPVSVSTWQRWRVAHPDTLALSADTGFAYDYSRDNYASYRDTTGLMFPVATTNNSVHAKTVVFGFDLGAFTVAYPAELLQEENVYRHELQGSEAIIALHDDGSVTMRRNGKTHTPTRLFWFAWFTFHPETELVRLAPAGKP